MSRYNIEFSTIESILNWYDSNDISDWVIFSGKPDNVKFKGLENEEESLQKLISSLQMIANEPAVENSYYLQLLPKDKKEAKPIILFCLKKSIPTVAGIPMGYYATKQDIDEIKQMINGSIDDEIDNLEEEPTKNILAGFLENPQIQTMIVSAISGLIGSFIIPSNVKTISGVEENLDDILKVLFSKGVKMEHLKKLSEMPKEKLNMLISML